MQNSKTTIGVVGLGYVGLPLAVELGRKRSVIGFDTNDVRIEELSKGIDRTLETTDKELSEAVKTFDASGAAALLMNVNNGDILSLVSLPNFNINQRKTITDKNYINKITKGVYELGSIFKTFTIALALENNLVKPHTVLKIQSLPLGCD